MLSMGVSAELRMPTRKEEGIRATHSLTGLGDPSLISGGPVRSGAVFLPPLVWRTHTTMRFIPLINIYLLMTLCPKLHISNIDQTQINIDIIGFLQLDSLLLPKF